MASTGRSKRLGLTLTPVPLKFAEPERDIRVKKDMEPEENGSEAENEEEEEKNQEENEDEVREGSDSGESIIRAPVFSQQVIAITDVAPTLESFGGSKVKEFVTKARHFLEQAQKNGVGYRRVVNCISSQLHQTIKDHIRADFGDEMAEKWKDAQDEEFLSFLEQRFQPAGKHVFDFLLEIRNVLSSAIKKWVPADRSSATRIVQQINESLRVYGEPEDAAGQKELAKCLVDSIGKYTKTLEALTNYMRRGNPPTSVSEFNAKLLRISKVISEAVQTAEHFGLTVFSTHYVPVGDGSKGVNDKRKREGDKDERPDKKGTSGSFSKAGKSTPENESTCNHCGWHTHTTDSCKDKNHKWANPDPAVSWDESVQGKQAKKFNKSKLFRKGKEKIKARNQNAGKGESCSVLAILSNIARLYEYTIDGLLYCASNDIYQHKINFLLDTCALQGNFISVDLAIQLRKEGCFFAESNHLVCSPVKNCKCFNSEGLLTFWLKYLNFDTGVYENIEIVARVLDIEVDLIIGLPSIRKYDLVTNFAHMFSERGWSLDLSKEVNTQDGTQTVDPPSVLATLVSEFRNNARFNMNEVLTKEVDYEEEFEETLPNAPWNEPIPVDSSGNAIDELDLVILEGSVELRARLKALLEKYRKVFSMRLNKEPALIDPMEIEVDVKQWQTPSNQRSARLQSDKMREELRRHINNMLDQHIIRPSKASAFSQVLLVPKPDNDTRFCMDLRALNKLHKIEGWPIPNIQLVLRNIGRAKPKFFGIMDLTQGYYQAPMAESSRAFTAFITFMGLYEWLRVPMGLKGAPAYFQRMIATVVLVGLINVICEAYIDDVCVYGSSEDEFLERLELVFARFEKHNITVKPSKCIFGTSEVEWLGRVINSNGISMSKEKRDSVFNFRKPTKLKELKSFIGLCEYFHGHVKNFSGIMRPIHDIMQGYTKATRTRSIKWTVQAEAAFVDIQRAIAECATLYFVHGDAPIFLQTDASDYGIGAYLFQIVDGIEKPVAFISKKLDKTQLKWSTIEKEAYAIYYAFRKLEYLIRDVPFVLQTDHANLVSSNEEPSAKVRR